jgi:hypothetical protein
LKTPIYRRLNVKEGRGTFQNDGLIPIVTNYQNVRFAIFLSANLVHSIDRMKFLLGDILKVTSKVKILLGHQCTLGASLQLDGNGGLDHWMGMVDWTTGWERWIGPPDGSVGLDHWMGALDWTTGWERWIGQLG